MKKPLRMCKTDKMRQKNREELYDFLDANKRPLICKSNSLNCKVYKDNTYIGTADLVTNYYDSADIDLFLQNDNLSDEISTDFCTRYENMEYSNGGLEIGCYKNPNRSKSYIVRLEKN